jgi:hypothetical protein
MTRNLIGAAILCAGLCACSGNGPAPQAKIHGPALDSLSVKQLEDVENTCKKFGDPNDPRVIYTLAYCLKANSAWNMRDYAKSSTAPVKSTLDTVH